MNNIASSTEVEQQNLVKQAQEKFKELNKEHFHFYGKQICNTDRRAKAMLKSDTQYQPVRALLLINALMEEVAKQ